MKPILLGILAIVIAASAGRLSAQESAATGADIASKESLRGFLEEMLAATKAKDRKRVSALIKKTEIPNHRQWFAAMYPRDAAESWVEPYEKNLARNEDALQQFFERMAGGDGQFLIQQESEVPRPNNSPIWAPLDHPNPSPEAYLATWKSTASPDPRPQFIGFFYFLDGAFRWNSVVHFEPRQPAGGAASTSGAAGQTVLGHVEKVGNGILPPRLIHSEAPAYTNAARSARFEGAVIVTTVIDIDGYPKRIQVTHPAGMGLDEKAVEAVRKYKFEPAKTRQGQPVAVCISIEIRFRLY